MCFLQVWLCRLQAISMRHTYDRSEVCSYKRGLGFLTWPMRHFCWSVSWSVSTRRNLDSSVAAWRDAARVVGWRGWHLRWLSGKRGCSSIFIFFNIYQTDTKLKQVFSNVNIFFLLYSHDKRKVQMQYHLVHLIHRSSQNKCFVFWFLKKLCLL